MADYHYVSTWQLQAPVHSDADIPTRRPSVLHNAPNSQLCAHNVWTRIRLPSTQIGGYLRVGVDQPRH